MAKIIRVEILKTGFFSSRFDPHLLKSKVEHLSAQGWEFINCQDVHPGKAGFRLRKKVWAIFEKEY